MRQQLSEILYTGAHNTFTEAFENARYGYGFKMIQHGDKIYSISAAALAIQLNPSIQEEDLEKQALVCLAEHLKT